VRRSNVLFQFLVVSGLLVVLIVILAVGSCGGGAASSTPPSSEELAGASSSTLPSSDTTSTTEGDSSETEADTSMTEVDTSTTEVDTSMTEDTSTTESVSTTAPSNEAVGEAVYTAEMSGGEVVPAVTTAASGKATFTVDDTGTRVSFILEVTDMTDVDASRVHVGAPGSNGSGVVVLLAGRYGQGSYTGQVASGVFDASLLIGPLKGKTIADFVALIQNGQAYVTVGTVENPNGEIRGQIK
jgi:cytoskeletal protein RodZ